MPVMALMEPVVPQSLVMKPAVVTSFVLKPLVLELRALEMPIVGSVTIISLAYPFPSRAWACIL